MRFIYITSILMFIMCSADPDYNRFEYDIYAVEYPSSWKSYKAVGTDLFISKYDTTGISPGKENPAMFIASFDSLDFIDDGVLSITDFANDLKFKMQTMTTAKLEADLQSVFINDVEWYVLKFKIEGDYNIISQKYYLLSKMRKYIIVNTTHIFGRDNEELNSILKSIEVSEYEPLDMIIDLTDTIN